jgi:hypothetical protein
VLVFCPGDPLPALLLGRLGGPLLLVAPSSSPRPLLPSAAAAAFLGLRRRRGDGVLERLLLLAGPRPGPPSSPPPLLSPPPRSWLREAGGIPQVGFGGEDGGKRKRRRGEIKWRSAELGLGRQAGLREEHEAAAVPLPLAGSPRAALTRSPRTAAAWI